MKENFILAYIFQGLNLWQLLLLFTLCGPEVRQNILVMRKEGCSFMMTNKKNEGIADILDIFFPIQLILCNCLHRYFKAYTLLLSQATLNTTRLIQLTIRVS